MGICLSSICVVNLISAVGLFLTACSMCVSCIQLQNQSPYFYGLQVMRLIPQEWCMHSPRCRHHARRDNVVITDSDMECISRWVDLGKLHSAKDVIL